MWNGRRKGGGAIVRAERKSVVGEAFVRHEGQYRGAAMVGGCVNWLVAALLQYCWYGFNVVGGEEESPHGQCAEFTFGGPYVVSRYTYHSSTIYLRVS